MAKAVRTHGRRRCAVEVAPAEVDAGAELTVTGRVSCPHGCDLRGQRISIRSHDDTELASAALTALDGEAYVTDALVLQAPLETGAHVYRAVLAAQEKDGVLHEATSTEFSFAAKPHAVSVNVWGLPSAIAAGERFRLKAGIKCSAGCKLAGRALSVFDHEGVEVGAGSLLADVWPGTSALYFADLEAQAPPTTGSYQWQVRSPGSDAGVPHAAGAFNFAVKVVGPPDHEVTVEVSDSETKTPIAGAHVLLHPYRAHTDAGGVAKLNVTKGSYQLVVSGFNYIAYESRLEVAADVTLRAKLAAEPEGQEDYP
jgi:hypothetical protein